MVAVVALYWYSYMVVAMVVVSAVDGVTVVVLRVVVGVPVHGRGRSDSAWSWWGSRR